MSYRVRISHGVLRLTLLMLLLALLVDVTPSANLPGITQQSTSIVSGPDKKGLTVSGVPHDPIFIDGDANFAATALTEGWLGNGSSDNPYIIEGLDIDLGGGSGYGIRIFNTQVNFTIRKCHVTGASTGAGIYLDSVMHGELLDNILDNNEIGIRISRSDFKDVVNNNLTNNNYGIVVETSNFNSLTNNTCTGSNYGIFLMDSSSNTVANNTCASNGNGILIDSAGSNTVSDNTCVNNTGSGIYLIGSNSNTVANNTCASNSYGIYLDVASSNDISWNVFADNPQNGMQLFGSNVFGYNFWSDYTGTDANKDGIGDTSYSGSGFVDPLPLMYQPGLRWIEASMVQSVEFQHFFRYEMSQNLEQYGPLGPLTWSIDDTTYFSIDNHSAVETVGILPIGEYDLQVDVTNIYGVNITGILNVRVAVDASNPPGWFTIPTNQTLKYGEEFDYQITAVDPSGIDYWTLNDMTNFILNVSFFGGGSTARITNKSVLESGSYSLRITVYDIYGNSLSAVIEVIVLPPEQDTAAPVWLVPPVDQDLWYGETFDYSLVASDSSDIVLWVISDTELFTVDSVSHLDYSIGRIRSIDTLNPGIYILDVEVHDIHGNVLNGTFRISVKQRLIAYRAFEPLRDYLPERKHIEG